jgi:hypothetical protein
VPVGAGSGLHLVFNAAFTVVNCTSYANTARINVAGAVVNETTSLSVTNSIYFDDFPGSIDGAGTIDVAYSIVDDAFFGGGPGNLVADPRFIDPIGLDGEAGTEDDNLRLRAASPAIDSGDTGIVDVLAGLADPIVLKTDFDGNPRTADDPDTRDTGVGGPPTIDRGAFEFTGCVTDLDGDLRTGFNDLLVILAGWGPCAPCGADLNEDGVIDFDDLLAVLSGWGRCG